jgi:hypothetical protein
MTSVPAFCEGGVSMNTVMKLAVRTLIGCGALLLVLGLIVWTGKGDALIPVHIALGVMLVLSLWTIAAIAARSGVPLPVVAIAAGWGALVVLLGLTQEALVPGGWHWTVQVAHLVISMGAIAWGRRLAQLVRRAASVRAAVRSPSPGVVLPAAH